MTYQNEQRLRGILIAVDTELRRAQKLYPEWWQDPVYAGSTAIEKAGETQKAINDYILHGKGSLKEIRTEAIQAVAMYVRFLLETEALWPDV